MENIGKDAYDEDLQSRDRVILVDLHDVFGIDALESALPLSSNVDNPEYDMTFSRLSYGKGNCIIRMIENIITLSSFNKGIHTYLSDFSNLNADRNDLWEYLNAAAKNDKTLDESLDLGTIMEGWTAKEGYPVITVSGFSGNMATLTQARFFLNSNAASSDFLWYVPISVSSPGDISPNTQPTEWMTDSESSKVMEITDRPYILNVKQTGYYRVNYDTENWSQLIDVLLSENGVTSIDRLNRAQMIDDSFSLARAGQLDYEVALRLSEYILYEKDYIPLKAALNKFAYLDLMYRDMGAEYTPLQDYLKLLLAELFDSYGFTSSQGEKFFDALLREELIEVMCAYEYGTCVTDAMVMFAEWMSTTNPSDDNNPIPADIKGPVYNTAIRFGGQEEWNFLFQQFLASEVDGERKRMIYGLGSTEDVARINNFLAMTINADSGIRKQDTRYVYRAVGSTAVGRAAQFDWMVSNFEDFKAYYGANLASQVNEIVDAFADGGKNQEDIDKLQSFWSENTADLTGSASAIDQAMENIKANMDWVAKNYQTVLDWIEAVIEEPTPPPTPNPPITTTTTPGVTDPDTTTTTSTAGPPGESTTTTAAGGTTAGNSAQPNHNLRYSFMTFTVAILLQCIM